MLAWSKILCYHLTLLFLRCWWRPKEGAARALIRWRARAGLVHAPHWKLVRTPVDFPISAACTCTFRYLRYYYCYSMHFTVAGP